MGMFSNRSFQVKLVKDGSIAVDDTNTESRDPAEGVLITQAYAQIAVETLSEVAKIIVVTTTTVVAVKTASNLVNAGLKYLTK